jgi:hypothetical protein
VCAAQASATNRFAEVGGNGGEPCSSFDPCPIETAINSAAAADDVTLLGGLPPTPYTTSTALVIPSNVTVHGTIGARPVIQTNTGSDDGVTLNAGSVLRDVTVNYTSVNNAAIMLQGGGTLERVTGKSTGGSSIAGCGTVDGGTPVIRDSVCWYNGPATPNPVGGVMARNGTADPQTLTLRNVTAVSSGANDEAGIFALQSSGGAMTVNATNVIALAEAGADVAYNSSFPPTAINLDHSNYDTESADPFNRITNPGTGAPNFNQTEGPVFVDLSAGDFHQQPTSAGTIDLGTATGVLGGELDFDGQPRIIGPLPDIGADELRHATTTAIACVPPSFTIGTGNSSCTATVTDTGTGPTTPTGDVNFATGSSGDFSGGGVCTLSPVSPGVASCELSYTPTAVGTGSHHITGSYAGDTTHEPSLGSTDIAVLARPTSTSVACSPTSLTLGAGSSTCTATVTDTANSPTPPTLNTGFTTDGPGAFSSSSCTLNGSGNQASCSVIYTPSAVGTGSHQITASYSGDPTHEASQGSTLLGVLAAPVTTPSVPTTPAPVPTAPAPFDLSAAIKKCKNKFPKGPKRKKCIKRAKRLAGVA